MFGECYKECQWYEYEWGLQSIFNGIVKVLWTKIKSKTATATTTTNNLIYTLHMAKRYEFSLL